MGDIKVIHLELNGNHYYFGSKKALCDRFGKEYIGIAYDSLRNVKITNEQPFKNKKCIIREGCLIQTSTRRGVQKKENVELSGIDK